MEAHHLRVVRSMLWVLVVRSMKLEGAILALLEQIDIFGHELDVSDIEHLYDRMGALQDAWGRLVGCPSWQAIDDAPLDDLE